MREHNEAVNRIDFIDRRATRSRPSYAPGEVIDVPQHDGSVLRLRKLHADYDPTDRVGAMNHMQTHQAARRSRHRAALRRPARPPTCTPR